MNVNELDGFVIEIIGGPIPTRRPDMSWIHPKALAVPEE